LSKVIAAISSPSASASIIGQSFSSTTPKTVYSKSRRGLSTRLTKNCASPVSRPRVESPIVPRVFAIRLISSCTNGPSPEYSFASGLPPWTTKFGTTRWNVRPL
jgi:hypothetical protein